MARSFCPASSPIHARALSHPYHEDVGFFPAEISVFDSRSESACCVLPCTAESLSSAREPTSQFDPTLMGCLGLDLASRASQDPAATESIHRTSRSLIRWILDKSHHDVNLMRVNAQSFATLKGQAFRESIHIHQIQTFQIRMASKTNQDSAKDVPKEHHVHRTGSWLPAGKPTNSPATSNLVDNSRTTAMSRTGSRTSLNMSIKIQRIFIQ